MADSSCLNTPSSHQVSSNHAAYIANLQEPSPIYARYFSALLIPQSSHEAFYTDLLAFRRQEHIALLLTTPKDTAAFNVKDMFLIVTRFFLESRFAHPWCPTSNFKEGWFKTGQLEARRKEETKWHRLLMPIWCGFRVRMMVDEDVLERWAEEQEQQRHAREAEECEIKERSTSDAVQPELAEKEQPHPLPTTVKSRSKQDHPSPLDPAPLNAEAYCMELSDDEINTATRDDDAAVAAKLFVGVAATGFLAGNKRARKYLMKKLSKK